MGAWPPLNLILSIFFFVVINVGFTLQHGLFSNIPQPLEVMFNESFVKHYGTYLDVVGISTIWSVATIFQKIGQLCGIFLIVPLIDRVGRKFVAVHIRYLNVVIAAIFLLFAFYLPSFEAFLIVMVLESALVQVKLSSIIIYFTECSPAKYRGVATLALCMGEPIASIISLTLFRPSVYGNEEKWFMIPIISIILGSFAMLYLFWIPETPHQLKIQKKPLKAMESFKFFGREDEETDALFTSSDSDFDFEKPCNYWTIFKTDSYRETLILICCMYVLTDISPAVVSSTFSVKLHTILGFDVETIMTIGTVQRLVFLPVFLVSFYVVEKFGRRPILMTAYGTLFVYNLIMIAATTISFVAGPSTVTMTLGILGDALTGFQGTLAISGMLTLVLCEMTPPCSRIAILQLGATFAIVISTIFNAVIPFAFNFFPPLPFLVIFLIHPGLIRYVYRNLPETAGRDMTNIVEHFEEAVIYGVSTRRSTVAEECAPLLPKK